jgi:hypothetical protein
MMLPELVAPKPNISLFATIVGTINIRTRVAC